MLGNVSLDLPSSVVKSPRVAVNHILTKYHLLVIPVFNVDGKIAYTSIASVRTASYLSWSCVVGRVRGELA